ncbi:MAG: phosphonopyruvate decarboxylase [Ruminococcus sp.]|uniref:phosphonopyruvate decarboxylase n=1 Tax=Ruminococcus sp. TaxID=41978 RepID=UPI0025EDDA44|nr:phosphonopyruvate decarboxylase [Ruminococcus sp.]MCR5541064.1 phosphonopyruvate decarboxylase [Ruminococcus sp.]
MDVKLLDRIIGTDFYTGVPDSLLRPLCDYLMDTYSTDPAHHIIAANEGNCTALAAGYHLATGKVPVVYMQNSGEGNIINPAASLLNRKVYAIPMLFIIGWRGEPNVHDEPQHIYQGEVTLKLLEDMEIESFVISRDTTEDEVRGAFAEFEKAFAEGRQAAFVIRKGALTYEKKISYKNSYTMSREEVIRHIVDFTADDPIVSTTGKASRELFEIREQNGHGHGRDFLTVGSMGHTSSIALGIALNKKDRKVWCIDGDGSMLMHMGSLAVIGSVKPENLVHIVINNSAHETVGGLPTAAGQADIIGIARACGYSRVFTADNFDDLDKALAEARDGSGLTFIEVKCALGARADLGRPTTTALENKECFMEHLAED